MPRFIPSFILHKVEKGLLTGDLSAYVILFDIVDFTVSCGKLFQMEKGGVEILSRYLGAAFHKPIEYLVYYGGFVSSFSGDSCTVIMPKRTPEEVLCSITRYRNILREYQNLKVFPFALGYQLVLVMFTGVYLITHINMSTCSQVRRSKII